MSSIFRRAQIFDSIVNLYGKTNIGNHETKKIPDPKAEDRFASRRTRRIRRTCRTMITHAEIAEYAEPAER